VSCGTVATKCTNERIIKSKGCPAYADGISQACVVAGAKKWANFEASKAELAVSRRNWYPRMAKSIQSWKSAFSEHEICNDR
jgi:hypothetical protein